MTNSPIVVTTTIDHLLGRKITITSELTQLSDDADMYAPTSVVGGEVMEVDTDSKPLHEVLQDHATMGHWAAMGLSTNVNERQLARNKRERVAQ